MSSARTEPKTDQVSVPVAELSGRHIGREITVPLTRGGTASGTLIGVEHLVGISRTPQVCLRLRSGDTSRLVVIDEQVEAVDVTQTLAAAVLDLTNRPRIFTADLAGGYRGEGWARAMEAVRELVVGHLGAGEQRD